MKQSILQTILQDVYNSTSFKQAKQIVYDRLESAPITVYNKQMIYTNIQNIEDRYGTEGRKSLMLLQQYLTNSMFKFMGMGNK